MLRLGTIDRTADRPVFRQIADDLRQQIRDGFLKPGDQLPSETTLMSHYGVARATLRSAIEGLRSEGAVIAEHGRGVFVRVQAPVWRLSSERFARRYRDDGLAASPDAAAPGRPQVDQLRVVREQPPARVRELLALPARRKVLARHRRYLLGGEPIELASSYIPLDIAGDTVMEQRDTGPGGTYARIEEAGHRLGEFTEEVSARMPGPEERHRLRLPAGTPVILVTRVAYDTGGRPVEMTDSIKAAHRHVLEYRFSAG